MMKMEIWKKQPEEEAVLRLRLQKREDGRVVLVAVDIDGDTLLQGRIISITADGELLRSYDVNEGLGLRLDANRRIEVA